MPRVNTGEVFSLMFVLRVWYFQLVICFNFSYIDPYRIINIPMPGYWVSGDYKYDIYIYIVEVEVDVAHDKILPHHRFVRHSSKRTFQTAASILGAKRGLNWTNIRHKIKTTCLFIFWKVYTQYVPQYHPSRLFFHIKHSFGISKAMHKSSTIGKVEVLE